MTTQTARPRRLDPELAARLERLGIRVPLELQRAAPVEIRHEPAERIVRVTGKVLGIR